MSTLNEIGVWVLFLLRNVDARDWGPVDRERGRIIYSSCDIVDAGDWAFSQSELALLEMSTRF